VDREVRAELDDLMRGVLVDCRFLYGNFAVKNTGERSRILPHQDWAIVDEERHVSVGVWSPLDDVDEKNGMLCVMRKSHLHVHAFRGGAPKELPDYIAVYPELLPEPLLARYHVPLRLKAGEAIFYDHRTVHYSPPNMTDEVRVAVLLGLVPREVPLVHYYRNGEREIALYAIPDDYFARVVYHERPDGPKLRDVAYECYTSYPESS
jgi:ectoine hydroxylase-related dioxygenase (phytanoyl-CoA dioxygenase family)